VSADRAPDSGLHPLQQPRLAEIRAGRKFWGYLDTEALQTRYVLAAHFVREARHVVEVGGYRDNIITRFLTGCHDSVTVYSLDAEFEEMALDALNGVPCRVRHVRDYFQAHPHPAGSLGVVALGLEILGDLGPFCALVAASAVAVLEVPPDYPPGVERLERVLEQVPHRVRCQVNLDLSPNAPLLAAELATSNMNRPFWRRNLYVLAPPSP
jgi:hypothetical protein